MFVRLKGKRNPYTLLVEMKITTATMENGMGVPQKPKNRTATRYSSTSSRDIPEGI
jgi:hypothetical protein